MAGFQVGDGVYSINGRKPRNAMHAIETLKAAVGKVAIVAEKTDAVEMLTPRRLTIELPAEPPGSMAKEATPEKGATVAEAEEAAEAAAEEAAAEAEAVGGSRQEGATADVELGQLLSDRFRQLSFRLSSSLGMEPEGRRAHESIAEEGPATDDQDEQLHSSRAVAQQAQLLAEAASVAVNRKDPTEGVASAVLDA